MMVESVRSSGQGIVAAARRALAWALGQISVPRGALARRFVLVGIALTLQNALEAPRDPVRPILGNTLISILSVAALAFSLLALALALRPADPPHWRWLEARATRVIVMATVLIAVPIGIMQFSHAAATVVQSPPIYENDGTTLDHYAAMQVLHGHNPYVTTDLIDAMHKLHQTDGQFTTPLRAGAFADHTWQQYPTTPQLRAAFAAEPAHDPALITSFETHLSYPALSVLPLVPLVWAGIPSVVPFFVLCLLVLTALLLYTVPRDLRFWVIVFLLADAPLMDATVTGDLDILYILLLFVAWRWMRRPLLSVVMLGLACAAKQIAWFFVPYYAIVVWRTEGPRAALQRLAGAGAVFLLINGPFIVANPHAWFAGILAPEIDPMFPLGNGLVRLSLNTPFPLLPGHVYTALEALTFVAGIVWFWRDGWRRPEIGWLLAVVPLFFAWRSLSTYFYFVGIPALVLLMWRVPALATPMRPLAETLGARGKGLRSSWEARGEAAGANATLSMPRVSRLARASLAFRRSASTANRSSRRHHLQRAADARRDYARGSGPPREG